MSMTVCLWFDGKAEEAARFYTSVFRDGSIGSGARYNKEASQVSGQAEGSTMTVPFEVEGQKFLALNGGPQFSFSEAVSFIVYRDTQEELDELWAALTKDGRESQCGWLKDKFGVSWQVVPRALDELLSSDDSARGERVMHAMLGMKKIDVGELRRAAEGATATV